MTNGKDTRQENRFLAALLRPTPRGTLFRYGFSVAMVLAAFAWRRAVTAWVGPGLSTYVTFYPVIMVAALLAGLGPGLVAIGVTGLLAVCGNLLQVGGVVAPSPVQIAGLVLFSANGLFMCTVAEIYRRNRERGLACHRELTLRESQARLAMFARMSFEGVAESAGGRIVDCNEQFAGISGYSPAELRGMEIDKLIPPEDRDRVRANILLNRESVLEHGLLRKDGTQVIVEAHGQALCTGSSVRFTAIRDVTACKQAELALKKSRDEMELRVRVRTRDLSETLDKLSGEMIEREHAEKELQLSEKRYRKVVEDQTETISRVRADGTYTFVNNVYCRVFGKTHAELLGNKWFPDAFPDDLPIIEERLSTLSPTNPLVVIENRVITGSGEVRWMQFINRGFFDDDGRLLETQAVGRDISERKKSEEALRIIDERLNLALTASRMGVWEWNTRSDAVYWSSECFEIFGVDRFDGTLESFTSVLHPDDVDPVMSNAKGAFADNKPYCMEFRIIRSDGEIRWLSDLARPTYDDKGAPLLLIGTVRDITESKLANVRLAELNEKLHALSEHLQTVQEKERLAIARDIHDDIGQDLTAMKLDLKGIEALLPAACDELGERLKGMYASIERMTSTVQRIAANLRPPLLDHMGLTAAIEWYVAEFGRRSGIECFTWLNEGNGALGQQMQLSVIRIVQEGLTNVARHARASEACISLCRKDDSLVLEISDNGCGITEEQIASTAAYGLMGMQERARLCRGKLEITAKKGGGTMVLVTLPLNSGDETS